MKKFDAVIKTDTAENWAKATKYIPEKGVIIIYEYDSAPPKIKMGDGVNLVNALPFLINPPSVNQGILEL